MIAIATTDRIVANFSKASLKYNLFSFGVRYIFFSSPYIFQAISDGGLVAAGLVRINTTNVRSKTNRQIKRGQTKYSPARD